MSSAPAPRKACSPAIGTTPSRGRSASALEERLERREICLRVAKTAANGGKFASGSSKRPQTAGNLPEGRKNACRRREIRLSVRGTAETAENPRPGRRSGHWPLAIRLRTLRRDFWPPAIRLRTLRRNSWLPAIRLRTLRRNFWPPAIRLRTPRRNFWPPAISLRTPPPASADRCWRPLERDVQVRLAGRWEPPRRRG